MRNLYISYYGYNFVTEVDLDTLAKTGRTVNVGTEYAIHIIRIGKYLYLLRDVAAGSPIVDKIDISTMTVVASLVLTLTDWLGSICPNQNLATDGTYLFISADRPFAFNGGIIRVNLATFTEVDFLIDALRVPILQMDANNNLYVGHWFSNRVDRIPAGTFAVDASLNMSVATFTQAMCCHGNYLYIANGANIAPDGHDNICRIDLITFTEDANIVTAATERWGWSLAADGAYLYCGLATAVAPTKIVRCTLDPLVRVDALTLVGHMDTWTLLVDEGYLIAVLQESPGSVRKIRRDTFVEESSLTLDPLEFDSWSSALGTVLPVVLTLPATEVK